MKNAHQIVVSLSVLLVVLWGCGPKQPAPTGTAPSGLSSQPQATRAESANEPPSADKPPEAAVAASAPKVKLRIHLMSKCPFSAKLLESVIALMGHLGERVELELRYIGRVRDDGTLSSMHGDEEVQGDMLQRCAEALGGTAGMLQFIGCQLDNRQSIPEGWEDCARSAALDVTEMNTCYEDGRGADLLRQSFEDSSAENVTGSPTIFLNDAPYIGGRSELSLSRNICRQIDDPKSPYCAGLPAPIAFPVAAVSDKRCHGTGCDPERFLVFVSKVFEGAEITSYDYSDPKGRALFERSLQPYLPVAIFGKDVVKEKEGYERLARRMVRLEDPEEYVYPLGRNWDPTAEVCDDGIDNTGNGKVDCLDESCRENRVCREEIPRRLDLFVMAHCPFGNRVVSEMKAVLDTFGRSGQNLVLELAFVGQVGKYGGLSSAHGGAELEEDMRQVCAQKYYKKNHKFMEYVVCRATHDKDDDWRSCIAKGIKASVISKCAEGNEGAQLLTASFRKTEALNISASPKWLLNNRYEMAARSARDIEQRFCEKNSENKECARLKFTEENDKNTREEVDTEPQSKMVMQSNL